MILNKPFLILNRLVIISYLGKVAYDEKFHLGVNLIRGQNSSGKSTISNFIFYVLGGDYNNWSTVALKCTEVYAEVNINDTIVTLKRPVSKLAMQPMSIYYSNYETAKADNQNWKTYLYKQYDSQISFSNVLFNLLGFPEVKSDADSTINIHQILRLLYIDQDTPTQGLFRFERFDLPLTRQAISEVLLGVYDDDLYDIRLTIKAAIKEHDEKKTQFESLNRAFKESGSPLNTQTLEKDIAAFNTQVKSIENQINNLKAGQKLNTTKNTKSQFEIVQEKLIPKNNQISDINFKINELELDVYDSIQFIQTLEKRVKELEVSLATRRILGELPLTHCPHCLNILSPAEDDTHCILCKGPLTEDQERSNASRMKQEMVIQVKESHALLQKKQNDLVKLKGDLYVFVAESRQLQKQLDNTVAQAQTTRDDRIDNLLIEKGTVEGRMQALQNQQKGIELLESLRAQILDLSRSIASLKLYRDDKESRQNYRLREAYQETQNSAIALLRKDLNRQAEFISGQDVDISFLKDYYSLDGGNNFSASSKIYLKNSVLFALLFASLKLIYMRYPRFIMCDNIEDKGMEKERSQNFQEKIVELSNSIQVQHQIIITTSMISDKLNNTSYCVGPFYTSDNKTLTI